MEEVAKKVLGYILAAIGLVGLLASSVPSVREKVFSFLPESVIGLIGTSLVIVSIIILGVGIFFLVMVGKSGKQKHKEVPIYKGKEIVGYRQE